MTVRIEIGAITKNGEVFERVLTYEIETETRFETHMKRFVSEKKEELEIIDHENFMKERGED